MIFAALKYLFYSIISIAICLNFIRLLIKFLVRFATTIIPYYILLIMRYY